MLIDRLHICPFNSEIKLSNLYQIYLLTNQFNEFSREQNRLREKQRALKAEWERFKAAQIQMASKAEAEFNAAVQEIGAGLGSAAAAAEGER